MVGPHYIEPGSPWDNGYIASSLSRLRDDLLNGDIFYALTEARGLIEMWRRHYNGPGRTVRLRSRPQARLPLAVVLFAGRYASDEESIRQVDA